MRFSRTSLVVALTIIAGGAVGGLLTFSPLRLWSPADDVAEQVTADPQAQVESVMFDVVDVLGNTRQADSTIIAIGGLDEGTAYTISDIQRATRSMWESGQFRDIRVRVDRQSDGLVTLIWEVDEQERPDVIGRAERILRTRIDEFGVEEPVVRRVGAVVDPGETLHTTKRPPEPKTRKAA